ncbi:MAG: hypothetical protein WKF73_12905 [Nocardioidaceae bacterium]
MAAATGGDESVAVTLITKDSVNPFFIAMQDGAEAAAEEEGVDITDHGGQGGRRRSRPDHRDRERDQPRR